jgi:hypothetical protein
MRTDIGLDPNCRMVRERGLSSDDGHDSEVAQRLDRSIVIWLTTVLRTGCR